MEPRHYQVVLWLVLLQLHTKSIVHAGPGCDIDPVFFEQWENVWLVSYNEKPCDRNSPWYVICEDSGWGDEEATVVCRERGYLNGIGGYLPTYTGAIGYSYIECEGTERGLKRCSFGDNPMPCSTSVGVVTRCYDDKPQAYIRDNYLVVSEEESAEVCIALSGPLMESVHITVETSDNKSAVANYDYIPVRYTLTFGPSYQLKQCVEVQIINDSLTEDWERLTVQLTTNSSAVDIATPQINIYIEPNNGSGQSGSCEDGSLTLSSGMDESSLQLVEMCSRGVWSPVCAHNWTMADASVACKELGYQGPAGLGTLESKSLTAAGVPDCKGNETALSDCFQQLEESVKCHYVLVDCETLRNDPESPDTEHPNITDDNEDDNEGADSDSDNEDPDSEDPDNEDPDNENPDNKVDSEGEGEDAAANKGSSAGVMTGVVVAGTVAVVVVVVVVGILVVVLVWWKRRMMPSTHNDETSSSQPAVDKDAQTHPDFHFDNPVYSSGVELTELSHMDPEHNLINPLYDEAMAPNSQASTVALTGHEYAVLEKSFNVIGGGGASDCNQYGSENGYSGDCQHTPHE